MKSDKEYRIKEYLGEFKIEVLVKTTIKLLAWKKEYEDWRIVTKQGNAWNGGNPSRICETFSTLEDAQKRVSDFHKGATYYYEIKNNSK